MLERPCILSHTETDAPPACLACEGEFHPVPKIPGVVESEDNNHRKCKTMLVSSVLPRAWGLRRRKKSDSTGGDRKYFSSPA